ncbi:SDR family oxidoreductase [Cellulosimicrobium sp. CUA-896]|uniref:SDR family oxidoreductase n=1 Tax=Cellulosimicrobium sp. CUA-896 TaxID=1517881 RepID=UPI00095F6BC4|nr:NAD(P)H-binding protein [Cellulosimicrobium sp. CUA-896]OLT48099.1 NmrA family transcriptional regulator [Cellulosimicrobium sp. CUA-896]
MRIVVVGGTGLVGSQVVARLQEQGHETVVAAPSTGVDTLSGEGVDAALAGADVVVDVSNSPSFADEDVMTFFTTSTRTLLDAEARARVRHHVILSIVGVDRTDAGYMRAKVAQEELVRGSGRGWTVVRATQFFEFAQAIADGSTVDGVVRIPTVAFQPIASADVARAVADAAVGEPRDAVVEIAGPERVRFDGFVRDALAARGDTRQVVGDPDATYFGARLAEDSIVPQGESATGRVTFAQFTSA